MADKEENSSHNSKPRRIAGRTRTFTLVVAAVLLSLMACTSSTEDPVAVVEQFHEAYNAEDIEGALALFADDAVAVIGGITYDGKDRIRHLLESSTCTAAMTDITVDGSTVVFHAGECSANGVRAIVEGGLITHLETPIP